LILHSIKRINSDYIKRVQLRVAQGGHNIPDDVVRRRFKAGLNQFEMTYKPIVNA